MASNTKVKRGPAARLGRWAPYFIALGWWLCFIPGFYSGDSFGALNEAASQITPAYTATWPLYLRAVTVGGQFPGAATLVNVFILTYALQFWARTSLKPRVGDRVAILMTATPLVGAVGITLWHDVLMTSGLLLLAGVASSSHWFRATLGTQNLGHLLLASVLVCFRPNGPPTLALFFCLTFLLERRREVAVHGLVAMATALAVWGGATIVTGNRSLVMPVFAQEWMRNDLSCLLSRDPSLVPEAGYKFAAIGGVAAWTESSGCWGLNPLRLRSSDLHRSLELIPRIWLNTALASPAAIIRVHTDRNAYLIPVPRLHALSTPFIHSTIEFPDRGIRWVNPKWSELARTYVRLWNAGRGILAFAGVWLAVLVVLMWTQSLHGVIFGPTVLVSFSLVGLLFMTAPIPDARYALFVLITGQAGIIAAVLDATERRRTGRRLRHQ